MNRCLFPLLVVVVAIVSGCGEDDGVNGPHGIIYRLLTDNGGTMLDWSPDGERIAFCRSGIWVIPSSGGEPTYLGMGESPSWSPDGSMLAYHVHGPIGGFARVYAMPDTGGTDTLLAYGGNPDWSPAGDRIAFDPFTTPENPNDGILVVPFGDVEPSEICPWGEHPDWSPDGSRIAFRTSRDCKHGIWVVPADGGTPVRITSEVHRQPRWSPDGRWIAYFIEYANQVWVVPSQGGTAAQLTGGPVSKAWPAWSPDGNKIAFSSYNEETERWEIWIASNLPF